MELFLRAWREFWAGLNPVPEPIRAVLGSPLFWLLVWLGLGASVGRGLFGARVGTWLGFALAGLTWMWWVPDGWFGVALVVVVLLAVRGLGAWLPATLPGRRLRGVKVCPDCAEEVRDQARVCRYCGHRFP